MTLKSAFDLQKCARPNILALKPYRCARDDYKDDGTNILLDANENAFGPGLSLSSEGWLKANQAIGLDSEIKSPLDLHSLHRYPDPHQTELKSDLCRLRNTHTHTPKNLDASNLFVGVGSDEAIDALQRCFCAPAKDRILICPPTYGMYSVQAQVNDIGIVEVPLDPARSFELRPDLICAKLTADPTIKQVYICSPGNPTAAVVPKALIQPILEHPTWNGIVIIDEAYIDFSPDGASLAEWVTEWPNLVVMQTLSKAFGMAGIRLGAAFASPQVAQLLNNLKAPYNVSSITSQLALQALAPSHRKVMQQNRERILTQRERMIRELPGIKGVGRFRGGFDANFLLTEILDETGRPCNETAMQVYEGLAEKRGVVVRFRGKEYGCEGCLRITVGTEAEVDRLLREMKMLLQDVHGRGQVQVNGHGTQDVKEMKANDVVA